MESDESVEHYREKLAEKLVALNIPPAVKLYRSRSSAQALADDLKRQEIASTALLLRLSYLCGPICPEDVYAASRAFQARLHEDRKRTALQEKIKSVTAAMLSRTAKTKDAEL
jgi:hypothetical protein